MSFEDIAYFSSDIIWNAISLAKIMMFFPRHSILSKCTSQEISNFRAYIKGEYFIDLSTGLSSKTQNSFNYLSMHVLSTIVQKGGDCKSKFCPPKVLEIVRKSRSGTNMIFEYNQILRFQKNGVCK